MMLGSKTLGTKCIRTSLCIMLANHDQNIMSRFRLAQSVFICKSWNQVITRFVGLNLQGLIDWKLDSIDRTSCRLIFLQNFPTQPKPGLTCRILCFTPSIKRKLLLGVKELVLSVGNPVSRGITISAPKVIEKEVSLMDLRGVVRYVQRTCGNSSTHFPFVLSSLFLSPLTMTLLTASAYPFSCGYAKVKYLFVMPRSQQYLLKALLSY